MKISSCCRLLSKEHLLFVLENVVALLEREPALKEINKAVSHPLVNQLQGAIPLITQSEGVFQVSPPDSSTPLSLQDSESELYRLFFRSKKK